MGKLARILNRATDAQVGLEISAERHVQKFVERVGAAHTRLDTAFAAKHAGLDGHVADIADMERDIEDFAKNDRSSDGENDGSAYHGTTPKT